MKKILLNFRFLIDPLFNNAVVTSCYCVERVLGNKNVRLNFKKLHVVRVSFFSPNQSIARSETRPLKKLPFRMCDLNSFKKAAETALLSRTALHYCSQRCDATFYCYK